MTRHERDGDNRYTPNKEAKNVKNRYRRKWRETEKNHSRRNLLKRVRKGKKNA